MRKSASDFYVTQGTLHHDALSYVERAADTELLQALQQGEFCYVLDSRQMGKSSLMVRTVVRLRQQGFRVAVLDLTALGQNLSPEQWYEGLLGALGVHLDLEDELDDFWQEHERLGPLQRWMRALREVVLPRLDDRPPTTDHRPPLTEPDGGRSSVVGRRLVIFIDEIDTVRSLPFSTDEFFAAIRECYNRRTEDPEFERLTFCLLGVATPSDLIRDVRTTPFNIGRRIELDDFREEEATSLRIGLELGSAETPGRPKEVAHRLLRRIFYWTGGHPYLTQRLCQAVAEDASVTDAAGVDQRCEELFLSARARERDDNVVFVRDRLLRSEADLASLLDVYRQVRAGKRVAVDETNPLVELLRLSGVARVTHGRSVTPSPLHPFTPSSQLRVRNRIYERVFDRAWVQQHMPDAELRRQQAAYRRGLVRAGVVSGAVLAVFATLTLWAVGSESRARQSAVVAQQQRDRAIRAGAGEREQRVVAQEAQRKASQSALSEKRSAATAREAARQAEENAGLARRKELAAQTAESQERAAKQRAENERLRGAQLLYDANMQLASQAWQAGATPRVSELLAMHIPKRGEEDLRGFEWRYQWKLLQTSGATFPGHGGAVILVGFTPDGTLMTLDEDLQLRHWNRAQRRPTHVWNVAANTRRLGLGPAPVALSPDRRTLAITSFAGPITLWDTTTGRVRGTLRGHPPGAAPRLVFTADNRRLASLGGFDGAARVWDLATGQGTLRLQGLEYFYPWDVALSTDGRRMVHGISATEYDLEKEWAQEGRRGPLIGHTEYVHVLATSPDGRTLASGVEDGMVFLWDLAARKEIRRFSAHASPISRLTFSADGRHLATGCQDATLKLWDVDTGGEPRTLQGHSGPIVSLAFSPDGKTLASGSKDGTARLWDLAASPDTGVLRAHANNAVDVTYSRDGKLLATAGWDGTARLWEARTGRRRRELRVGTDAVWRVALSPDGRTLATGDTRSEVKLWDPATGALRRTLAGLPASFTPDYGRHVGALAFSPDGRVLAAGFGHRNRFDVGYEAVIKLWDTASGREIRALPGHKNSISALAFSRDGRTLVSSSQDGTVKLWEVGNWREIRTLTDLGNQLLAMALSRDGRRIAAGGGDRTIGLRDLDGDRPALLLKGHTGNVTGLAFSPDGRTLASTSWDKTVRLWDAVTGIETRAFTGQPGIVRAGAFAPDGNTLATANEDGTVRLWEAGSLPDIARAAQPSGARAPGAIPASARALMALAGQRRAARECLGKRQWAAALRHLEALVQADPGSGWARAARGLALARLGRAAEAERACVRAVAAQPGDPEVWIVSGHVHIRLGRWDRAEADFARAIDRTTGDAMVWYRRALLGLQSSSDAFGPFRTRLLERVAARQPRDPAPWAERGRIAFDLKQWEQAVAAFGEAIARRPADPGLWIARGQARAAMERWHDAAADFAQALERGAADPWIRELHTLTLLGDKDREGYRRACAAMLARVGETEDAYTALVTAAACMRGPDAVADRSRLVRLAETALRAYPNHSYYLYLLAATYYRSDQFPRAIDLLRKARTAGGEDGKVLLFEAMAHHRLGESAEARRCLDEANTWATRSRNTQDWLQQLTYDLLRREAEALMGPKAAGKP